MLGPLEMSLEVFKPLCQHVHLIFNQLENFLDFFGWFLEVPNLDVDDLMEVDGEFVEEILNSHDEILDELMVYQNFLEEE